MSDEVTEEMVEAADKAAWAYDSDESNDPLSSYGRMRAALTAARTVDPLVAENELLCAVAYGASRWLSETGPGMHVNTALEPPQ